MATLTKEKPFCIAIRISEKTKAFIGQFPGKTISGKAEFLVAALDTVFAEEIRALRKKLTDSDLMELAMAADPAGIHPNFWGEGILKAKARPETMAKLSKLTPMQLCALETWAVGYKNQPLKVEEYLKKI